MKKTLPFLFIFIVLFSTGFVFAQHSAGNNIKPKKLVVIPGTPDSSGNEEFCICKIVTFISDNYRQRTDAIFAGSSPENPLSIKDLLKHIEYELQQALVFFDSYKLIYQVNAKADCNSLYEFLREQYESINRYTFLKSTWAFL